MDELEASEEAYRRGDTSFFAQRLAPAEHYRIALAYPRETLFLDIETTGLSRFYDRVTIVGWSLGSTYGVVCGESGAQAFQSALRDAKSIVTFNGSQFDLPFLVQEFPAVVLPTAHTDLRYLARRVGLVGGQKHIEGELRIRRPQVLESIDGEHAVALWHRFAYGQDVDALRLLVAYNHADIEGMKAIFEVVTRRLYSQEQIPRDLRRPVRFARSALTTELIDIIAAQSASHHAETGRRSHIELHDLTSPCDQPLRVVGIDLTGSESRPSGWCLLDERTATTKLVASDRDLLSETIRTKPHLVSIDSPLSLPRGRTRVSDDDPGRSRYGIMRECERTLKRRGINVYPSLIPSMQRLTARGIRLANRFRELGIPVIESYPGAAQDIMGIPRKRAGLDLLRAGLARFGVEGSWQFSDASHDELDAITSAVVGVFFWSGKFEALGSADEDFLIIPDLNRDPARWRRRRVIGLSGPIGAGKTTAARYLEQIGFLYCRFSLVLEGILNERGIKPTRETLQRVGLEVHENPGQRWLCEELLKLVSDGDSIVADGLRHPEDHAFMVERFGPGFTHIHVNATRKVRAERVGGGHDATGALQSADDHPVEANVGTLGSLAHFVVNNGANAATFLRSLDEILGARFARPLAAESCQ